MELEIFLLSDLMENFSSLRSPSSVFYREDRRYIITYGTYNSSAFSLEVMRLN